MGGTDHQTGVVDCRWREVGARPRGGRARLEWAGSVEQAAGCVASALSGLPRPNEVRGGAPPGTPAPPPRTPVPPRPPRPAPCSQAANGGVATAPRRVREQWRLGVRTQRRGRSIQASLPRATPARPHHTSSARVVASGCGWPDFRGDCPPPGQPLAAGPHHRVRDGARPVGDGLNPMLPCRGRPILLDAALTMAGRGRGQAGGWLSPPTPPPCRRCPVIASTRVLEQHTFSTGA